MVDSFISVIRNISRKTYNIQRYNSGEQREKTTEDETILEQDNNKVCRTTNKIIYRSF
jgi:hypothetical protein